MTLVRDVAALLDRAAVVYDGHVEADNLRQTRRRLDEPLRVAIAGKVKAGKSTLLNALVGEILAPTDAGECTKVVTWYANSHTSRVTLEPVHGETHQVPFTRQDGAIDVEFAGHTADEIRRLVVEWPSASLQDLTLIDTPGIDSLSPDISARSHAFLASDDQERPADAVIYLMRHLHASDHGFLESFHDDEVAQATPVNAVAVLSRADEIGVGRLDAMASSARIAVRYREDPQARRLCQTVVPVAGLLAESSCTLRQAEFRAFQMLAASPAEELERLLLSADRFVGLETEISLDPHARSMLLERFGVYGVRVAVDLIRRDEVSTAPDLAARLRRLSGLDELRGVLHTQFATRRDLLKARAGLTVVSAVLRRSPILGSGDLFAEVERIDAGAHEFAELRLLNALRNGVLDLPEHDRAVRLLAGEGSTPWQRLGLEPTAGTDDLVTAAKQARSVWQKRAENPMTSRDVALAASVLVRSAEGILAHPHGRSSPTPGFGQ